MPPLGKTILHLHRSSIANLFDDGQPQPIVVALIGLFIKPPEDPAAVKRLFRTRIAHPQTMFLEPGMDLTLAHIVPDGITKEIIEQNIQQLPVRRYRSLYQLQLAMQAPRME